MICTIIDHFLLHLFLKVYHNKVPIWICNKIRCQTRLTLIPIDFIKILYVHIYTMTYVLYICIQINTEEKQGRAKANI